MRVFFLTSRVPPALDGVGDFTWNLCAVLRDSGVEAEIITSENQVILDKTAFEVHSVIGRWNRCEVTAALSQRMPDKSDWICLQYVPQMYGGVGWSREIALLPKHLKDEFGSRICVFMHELASDWSWHPRDFLLAGLLRLQARTLLKNCDLILTTCARYENEIKKILPKGPSLCVIPAGANIPAVNMSAAEKRELKTRYNLEKNKVLAVFGKFAPFKNYALAVKTLKQVKARGYGAKLMIIGSAQSSEIKFYQEIMKQGVVLNVRDDMIMTGNLSPEEVSRHLQLADIYLFTQSDGVSTRSTTMMSALSHGLPIVTFEPHPGNYKGHQLPWGEQVHNNSETEFMNASVKILEDGFLPAKSQMNRDYYHKHFSWPVLSDQFMGALKASKDKVNRRKEESS